MTAALMTGRYRVEALTAICAAIAAAIVAFATLPTVTASFATIFAALVAASAAFDVVSFRLPDVLTGAIFVVGAVFVLVDAFPPDRGAALVAALTTALAVGLLLLALRAAYFRLRGRTGLGLGDVKLAAAGAVWVAPETLAFAILAASLGAILIAVVGRLRGRGAPDGRIPFGAFLGPAIWIAWYLAVSGIVS